MQSWHQRGSSQRGASARGAGVGAEKARSLASSLSIPRTGLHTQFVDDFCTVALWNECVAPIELLHKTRRRQPPPPPLLCMKRVRTGLAHPYLDGASDRLPLHLRTSPRVAVRVLKNALHLDTEHTHAHLDLLAERPGTAQHADARGCLSPLRIVLNGQFHAQEKMPEETGGWREDGTIEREKGAVRAQQSRAAKGNAQICSRTTRPTHMHSERERYTHARGRLLVLGTAQCFMSPGRRCWYSTSLMFASSGTRVPTVRFRHLTHPAARSSS